jgi:hypothetical protein
MAVSLGEWLGPECGVVDAVPHVTAQVDLAHSSGRCGDVVRVAHDEKRFATKFDDGANASVEGP